VTVIDVIGRYFGAPLRGAHDISTMAMVLVVFGGMALCDRLGGHISVDIFEERFPRPVILIGDIATALIGAAIFLALAWTVWQSALLSQMLHLSTNIINLPKAWFQYAIVAASLITALGMILRAVDLLLTGHVQPRGGRI